MILNNSIKILGFSQLDQIAYMKILIDPLLEPRIGRSFVHRTVLYAFF